MEDGGQLGRCDRKAIIFGQVRSEKNASGLFLFIDNGTGKGITIANPEHPISLLEEKTFKKLINE